MKILFGYDGSPHAAKALSDLELAGIQSRVHIRMLAAIPGAGAEEELRSVANAALDSMRAAARSLRKRHPGWEVKAETSLDSPAKALLKIADAWRPDLIVVGSRGWSALGRLLLGSVAEKVLAHASGSVRICKQGSGKKHLVPRILIGYDGSPGAIVAVNQVAGRSWARGTKVRIVTATASTIPAESKSGIGRLAEKAAARFTELGMDAEAVARKGDARKVLLAEAKAFEADCIFIGSKGGSGVTRFLLGSVSSAVAAHSPCSVEVVRKSRRSKA